MNTKAENISQLFGELLDRLNSNVGRSNRQSKNKRNANGTAEGGSQLGQQLS